MTELFKFDNTTSSQCASPGREGYDTHTRVLQTARTVLANHTYTDQTDLDWQIDTLTDRCRDDGVYVTSAVCRIAIGLRQHLCQAVGKRI